MSSVREPGERNNPAARVHRENRHAAKIYRMSVIEHKIDKERGGEGEREKRVKREGGRNLFFA